MKISLSIGFKFYFLLKILLSSFAYSYPIFNDTLTLSDFGIVPNNNTSLQATNQYNFEDPVVDSMKTNNFQTFQLKFGDYAKGRYPCRIGLFNISQSAETVGSTPFGPRISLPAYIQDGNPLQGVECSRFMQEPADPSSWTFSFTESLLEVKSDISESMTNQIASFWYIHSEYTNYMKDLNVPLSGYHDIMYEDVTPYITLGKGRVSSIELDGAVATLPVSGTSILLTPSNKFKFVVNNEPTDPISNQIWLIYAQSDTAKTPVTFTMHYKIDGNGYLYNITLTANKAYTGYFRVAAIQNSLPSPIKNPIRSKTAPSWELAMQIQSMPATPLAMFLLWPYQWTSLVGPIITANFDSNTYISSYSTASLILPVLARSNYPTATAWFIQLVDKQNKGEVVFDVSTNSFITQMHMLVANYYASDIQSYQDGIPRGVSTPYISIAPNISTMEKMFDDHRSEMILSYDINFNSDGSYEFDVSTLDVITTFPNSLAVLPLFSFLGYQTIADGYNIVDQATNKEPIKGDVNYVQGNIGPSPGSYTLKFKNQPLPGWASRILPDDFWNRIGALEKTSLICQLNQFLSKPLPDYSDDVYNQGKILSQLSLSAYYGTYVLLAQQGILPEYGKNYKAPSSVVKRIQPVINKIKELLSAWLYSKTFEGQAISNYFVGSQEGNGIVAIKGTFSPDGGVLDSGNAVFTGHNRQYGYFLEAAAIVAMLDNLFGNPSWLASPATNGIAGGTVKDFVNFLWRDYANPSIMDVDDLPFYRYGNSWEGMSSSKGMPPVGAYPSRNNESIGEDFNGYYAAFLYGSYINNASLLEFSALSKQGFDGLVSFAYGNMIMCAKAGKGMFYNNPYWVYANQPFNYNLTTGIEWDDRVDSAVNFPISFPPASFPLEGSLYSKYRFDIFCTDVVQQFNTYCGSDTNESCCCECNKN